MNSRTLIAAAVLGLGALMASPQVPAQGFYMGASVGTTDADDGSVIPDLIDSGSVDGKDSGFKIFGGYAFTQSLALEFAYLDLGKISYSGTFGGLPVTGGQIETTAFNFSAVGTLPLNPSFSLFAKAGVLFWDAKARDTTGGTPFSASDDGSDLSLGLGATYHFNKNLGLRAEWEQFDAGDGISLLSVGAVYKF